MISVSIKERSISSVKAKSNLPNEMVISEPRERIFSRTITKTEKEKIEQIIYLNLNLEYMFIVLYTILYNLNNLNV